MKTSLNILELCLFSLILISSSCNDDPKSSCEYGPCDVRRKTVMTITDQKGKMTYMDSIKKWAVNVTRSGYDNLLTCIICGEIADSLKSQGKEVMISGELKESCGNPRPIVGGQHIFYVHLTKLK